MGLLVVDSLLIAVFGSYLGVVGMKAYHQWNAKPAATVPAKPAKTETPPAPGPVEAKPEPAKAVPTKPAKEPPPASGERPAPSGTAAPGRQPPPPSLGSEPAGDAAVKALPVDFSIQAPDAKSVKLAGAFLVRGGGKKDMVRGSREWNSPLRPGPTGTGSSRAARGRSTHRTPRSRSLRGRGLPEIRQRDQFPLLFL